MVVVSIRPKKGNCARFYPHSGYLGLSPVVLSGNVITRLEEDLEPVQASKIIVRVRCYESIGNSASTSSRPESNSSITNPHHPPSSSSSSSSSSHKSTVSILWQTEKIVWDAHHTSSAIPHSYGNSDDETFCQPIGDSIHPWRLTIPVLAVQPNKGGNALGSITYKNWRTWWSLEAVIYHQPMGNYGNKILKSYQLHLPNYYNSHQRSREHLLSTNSLNLPDHQQQQQHSENQISNKTQLQSTTSYGLRYSIESPTCLACGDQARLSISISYPNQPRSSSVCTPSQPRVSIKRVSVCLVRTISTESVSSNPEDQSEHLSKPRWKLRRIGNNSQSLTRSTKSIRTFKSRLTSTVQSNILEADFQIGKASNDSDQHNSSRKDPNNSNLLTQSSSTLRQSILITVPQQKSRFHYSIGETCQSGLASVNYAFVFKIVLKTKLGSYETIELSPIEVKISSVSTRELKMAIDHLNKHYASKDPTTDNQNSSLEPRAQESFTSNSSSPTVTMLLSPQVPLTQTSSEPLIPSSFSYMNGELLSSPSSSSVAPMMNKESSEIESLSVIGNGKATEKSSKSLVVEYCENQMLASSSMEKESKTKAEDIMEAVDFIKINETVSPSILLMSSSTSFSSLDLSDSKKLLVK
ncbi:expressed protein [Phakopsora pachyrhizi]|uniref:Expressed protein n=1 Tax=Phakopsora pachyrhizi TaxID=170000 RepID=A0AAV0BJ79_PHAPC|nr:expressed protein [Phakopsora pachyrhizi]